MWDVGRRKSLGLLHRLPKSVWSVAFRPDGQRLAAGCFDGTVALWDTSTLPSRPTAPQQVLIGPANRLMSVGFSGDGRYLASGSDQGLINLWNGQTFAQEVTLRGGGGEIRSLSFSPDGALLAGGAYGPSIVWDLANLRHTLAEMGLDW
jgi:WD40 repeat protein